jgi:hypothetical protein
VAGTSIYFVDHCASTNPTNQPTMSTIAESLTNFQGAIADALQDLERSMEDRFDELDIRLGRLDDQVEALEALDNRLGRLDDRVDELEHRRWVNDNQLHRSNQKDGKGMGPNKRNRKDEPCSNITG